jgi:hypothetical protein
MKTSSKKNLLEPILISLSDFLKSYNQNIPAEFPRVSLALLVRYKSEHPQLFKHGELWSLDEHRKKIMDWVQINNITLNPHK